MKITIAYLEETHLQSVLDALKPVIKGAKIRKIDKHKPFRHAYITIKDELKHTT